MRNGFKSANRKYKVYNFVENCWNINYNIKYEILSHKTVAKIKKREYNKDIGKKFGQMEVKRCYANLQ